jgi:hypothetical protein
MEIQNFKEFQRYSIKSFKKKVEVEVLLQKAIISLSHGKSNPAGAPPMMRRNACVKVM